MILGTEPEGGEEGSGARGQLLFKCRCLMFHLQKNKAKLCAGVILTKTELIFRKE